MKPGQGSKRTRGRNSGRRPTNRQQLFDSNGPSVRIRGNAIQVHEKYLGLARDAASAGNRVAAENFYQHAEHYFRIYSADLEERALRNPGNGQAPEMQHRPAGNGSGSGDGNGAGNGSGNVQDRNQQDRNHNYGNGDGHAAHNDANGVNGTNGDDGAAVSLAPASTIELADTADGVRVEAVPAGGDVVAVGDADDGQPAPAPRRAPRRRRPPSGD